MTEILIQYIESVALHAAVWGYLVIFLLMTIESSLVPFPSEVVMIPAGFLAAHGRLSIGAPVPDLILAVLVGVAGSLAGAFFNYFLATWAGRPFLRRYGKYFFLPVHHLDRAEEIFNRYGSGTTFVCRLIPAIRQLISLPAGLARMPLPSFVLWTTLGAGIWVVILTGIGYSFGLSTAGMSYADLVHQGKAAVSRNLVWILLGCAVVFASYVWLTNRIMGKKGQSAVSP
ncbi:MAG: DedA family protein [Polyangiaceae bacterium]|nr:DedA family protein [Polyangiaceae bacterium]